MRAARLEESESPQPRAWIHRWSFIAGAGVTAALALGIGMSLWMSGSVSTDPPVTLQAPAVATVEWSTAAFERGLESHFRSGRKELAGLGGRGSPDREALVASLIEQNRIYARLALQNEAPEVARVLRSFERILEQLGREDLSAGDAAALLAQLEFEFTVILTKLGRASSQRTEPENLEISL
jgi:hypothetical protein